MTSRASVREALRAATRETHQRLHRHSGLSAAARGAIGLDDYRQLLMRLYGFHLAFENTHASAMQKLGFIASSRAELIALDLAALGIMRFDVCRLPQCAALRQPSSEACALGALYVVEGSALGGALIAEALAPVVGEARRFFLGGPSRLEVWPGLLARVETLAPGVQQARAIDAAVETFRIFEEWMFDWRAAPSGLARFAIDASSETKRGVPS
ncbi:biliverdin-producing heme oxygenase [Methylocystis sp. L43]|jgi:heme oxygenase|uniref:biliverdin-producing heme oxygenase n=1 Tax=unclassified Methylocystis TaxID=2625913 RepID=UPI0018C33109|nr:MULTISPECIES: biliverdin-producing heme oxygenase [unclassified Methylocystis]MBG0797772.1 biliverdin-producing heme oxygenase [Methylocystis sp. L43]MBG0806006.1 biliverdin-producing heme oxygenase [Methylocystis sp. H15]